MTFYTVAITLILVMDPLGNIPVFLSVLQSVEEKRRRWVILREALIAFVFMVLFLFFGQYIMHGLHITTPALGVAGGIILFIIAIRMIFPQDKIKQGDQVEEEPFIVPLAVPLTAGPSTLAMVLLFASQHPGERLEILFAIIIAAVVFTLIMLSSTKLSHLLGRRGLIAVERLMGMLLTVVAVQMFLTGVSTYLSM